MSSTKQAKISDLNREESQRLRAIWDSTGHGGLSQDAFGQKYEIGSQAAVGFFLGGKSALSLKAAKGFAHGLNCKISDFSDRLAAEANELSQVSDHSFAAITAPMGFITTSGGPNQITTPRGEEQSNVSEIPRRAKVPLISLIQAGELTDVEDLFHPGMAAHWVEPRYTTPSEASYALMVEGDSMESPVPGALTFPEGTIVIVDPNGAAGPNSYVIAKDVFTQKATFKKLTTDGVRWFLKPLNPAYATVEIDDPAMRVIGKVVEHQPPGGKL